MGLSLIHIYTDTPSDGVITGYGLINESLVYVYSQDASVLGGSMGEMHAKKITKIYDLSLIHIWVQTWYL